MRIFAQKSKATQQTMPAKSTIPGRAHFGQSREINSVLHLQRTIGNQVVQRLLQSNTGNLESCTSTTASNSMGHSFSQISIYPKALTLLQTKLTVNTPGDKFEKEADRVAEQVMGMQNVEVRSVSPGKEKIQRKCAACESSGKMCPKCAKEEEKIQLKPIVSQIMPLMQRQYIPEEEFEEEEKSIQTKSNGGGAIAPTAISSQICSSKGGGSSLPDSTNQFMSIAFGTDFSNVRIHTGNGAVQMNQNINARAFTHGRDIYFNKGQYNPQNRDGKKLLAHELTHTLQQKATEKSPNSNAAFIQRDEKETKQLCPLYWRYKKINPEKYNCAGLSHRTYKPIMAKALVKLLPESSARSKCKPGEVKHWLWAFYFHLENHKGKVTQKPQFSFHTVAGVVGKKGNDPTDVYSKNGKRPVEGPGTGPSFKPKNKEHATKNTPKAELIYDNKGKPIYKIRKKIEAWTYCLPCPKS